MYRLALSTVLTRITSASILDDVEYVRLSLRLLRDLTVLNEKKHVRLVVISEDVAVQHEKWFRYERKRALNPQPSNHLPMQNEN